MKKTDDNNTLKKDLAKSHGGLKAICTELVYNHGDKLAKREKYKKLSGIEAVHFYLINKHNWLPSQVKAMDIEDLAFCLSEEKL